MMGHVRTCYVCACVRGLRYSPASLETERVCGMANDDWRMAKVDGEWLVACLACFALPCLVFVLRPVLPTPCCRCCSSLFVRSFAVLHVTYGKSIFKLEYRGERLIEPSSRKLQLQLQLQPGGEPAARKSGIPAVGA